MYTNPPLLSLDFFGINIGNISMSNTTKVGYLSQNHNFSDEMNSVYEELMEVFIEEHKLWHEIQKINSFLAVSEGEELEKNLELLSDLTTKYEAKNGYEIEYKRSIAPVSPI